MVMTDHGAFVLVNVYGPAISTEESAEERYAFKLRFYEVQPHLACMQRQLRAWVRGQIGLACMQKQPRAWVRIFRRPDLSLESPTMRLVHVCQGSVTFLAKHAHPRLMMECVGHPLCKTIVLYCAALP